VPEAINLNSGCSELSINWAQQPPNEGFADGKIGAFEGFGDAKSSTRGLPRFKAGDIGAASIETSDCVMVKNRIRRKPLKRVRTSEFFHVLLTTSC
jgi:hypothetical protein